MSDRRKLLEKQEEALVSEIETQSVVLKKKAGKVAKTSLIIGASVLIGYTVYSLLSDNKKPTKKAKKNLPQKAKIGLLASPLLSNLLQSALKKGIELMVTDKTKK